MGELSKGYRQQFNEAKVNKMTFTVFHNSLYFTHVPAYKYKKKEMYWRKICLSQALVMSPHIKSLFKLLRKFNFFYKTCESESLKFLKILTKLVHFRLRSNVLKIIIVDRLHLNSITVWHETCVLVSNMTDWFMLYLHADAITFLIMLWPIDLIVYDQC